MARANQMLMGYITTKNARIFPDKTVLVFKNVRLSYKEFNGRICRLANGLLSLGVRKGDRVGMLITNCHQYLEFYFACFKIGAIATPINFRFGKSEITYVMNHAGVKALITGKPFLKTIEALKAELRDLEKIICIDYKSDGVDEYENLLANSPAEEPMIDLDDDEVIFIGYTSGTTGKPKGAMITHRNLLSSTQAIALHKQMQYNECYLCSAPLFHVAGQGGVTATIFFGVKAVILDKFDPKLVLEIIDREKVTMAFFVPTMLHSILEFPDLNSYDLSSLRHISYGAAPMPPALIKRAIEVLKVDFNQSFGQTETTSGYITILNPEDHVPDGSEQSEHRLTSMGKEGINAQLRIVDNEDREMPRGQIGEIIIRGQHVMKGYWKDPEQTARALRNGWLHTGDMGYMDEDGYVFLVDRKKDMIITGGENVYPREIENLLFEHPVISDAAVIGVPDEKWGESIKAFVVLKEGAEAGEEEIIEYCKSSLASYKKPKSVEFLKEIPRNPSGKVLKRVLREPYWKGMERKI
jgi:O-succinylbenzoate-CoA ligase